MTQNERNNPLQLDFLDMMGYKPSLEDLREQIKILNQRNDRMRKSLYARQTAIEYKNECLEKDLEFLKANICKEG